MDCSSHGTCVNGTCVCSGNFTGDACEKARCPMDCSSHGTCVDGECACAPGFTGVGCELHACPAACHERGTCDHSTGICKCDPGWSGAGCEHAACPNDCNGHGLCIEGGCYCAPGFEGPDCSQLNCPCNGGKRVVVPHATETAYFGASHASTAAKLAAAIKDYTPNAPITHFVANASCACECYEGSRSLATGPTCETVCPGGCSGHGKCDGATGKCHCDYDYFGIACDNPPQRCPNDCSFHGACHASGECLCDYGWSGKGCQWACPNGCSGHGHCMGEEGGCQCYKGWTGEDCALPDCHGGCHGNGVCKEDGNCECFPGFIGDDCAGTTIRTTEQHPHTSSRPPPPPSLTPFPSPPLFIQCTRATRHAPTAVNASTAIRRVESAYARPVTLGTAASYAPAPLCAPAMVDAARMVYVTATRGIVGPDARSPTRSSSARSTARVLVRASMGNATAPMGTPERTAA